MTSQELFTPFKTSDSHTRTYYSRDVNTCFFHTLVSQLTQLCLVRIAPFQPPLVYTSYLFYLFIYFSRCYNGFTRVNDLEQECIAATNDNRRQPPPSPAPQSCHCLCLKSRESPLSSFLAALMLYSPDATRALTRVYGST